MTYGSKYILESVFGTIACCLLGCGAVLILILLVLLMPWLVGVIPNKGFIALCWTMLSLFTTGVLFLTLTVLIGCIKTDGNY